MQADLAIVLMATRITLQLAIEFETVIDYYHYLQDELHVVL